MTFTPLEKGYDCPSLEDCSKCPYHKTLCFVYGKEGQKRRKELEEDYRKRSKNNDRKSL